jgi:hypothetical protein
MCRPNRDAFLLSILVAAISGCVGGETAEEDRPIESASGRDVSVIASPVEMANPQICINSIDGYAVEYPEGWQAYEGDISGPCTTFDTEPIEIGIGSELPLEIAITIGFEGIQLEALTGDVFGRRNLSSDRTTVDGKDAVRIESVTTGEGLHDRGISVYQYFVDLGDTTMIAGTYGVGEIPFERKRQILDAMMSTFDFDGT